MTTLHNSAKTLALEAINFRASPVLTLKISSLKSQKFHALSSRRVSIVYSRFELEHSQLSYRPCLIITFFYPSQLGYIWSDVIHVGLDTRLPFIYQYSTLNTGRA